MSWLDIHTHCEIITTMKPINTSIPSQFPFWGRARTQYPLLQQISSTQNSSIN